MFNQVGQDSSLKLSVVKNVNTKVISNDHSRMRSSSVSSLSISSVGSVMSGSRIFTSTVKREKEDEEELENIHE